MKKTSILDGILNPSRIHEFAEYADKHEVFELLENLLSGVLQDRPDDPISHMINALKAKKSMYWSFLIIFFFESI